MGDTGSSCADEGTPIATVASILGIKSPLRFRLHGSSQRAHVILRRVELSEESSDDGRTAYYSLFAQKRIEVKPGKEIYLSLGSSDGTFKDKPVIFEADLPSEEDDGSDEEEVQMPEEFFPSSHVIPPKLRRVWTKSAATVTPEHMSFLKPSRPVYATVAIQTEVLSPVSRSSLGVQTDIKLTPTSLSSCSQTDDYSPSHTCVGVQKDAHVEPFSIPELSNRAPPETGVQTYTSSSEQSEISPNVFDLPQRTQLRSSNSAVHKRTPFPLSMDPAFPLALPPDLTPIFSSALDTSESSLPLESDERQARATSAGIPSQSPSQSLPRHDLPKEVVHIGSGQPTALPISSGHETNKLPHLVMLGSATSPPSPIFLGSDIFSPRSQNAPFPLDPLLPAPNLVFGLVPKPVETKDPILSGSRRTIPEIPMKDVLALHESNASIEHMLSATNHNMIPESSIHPLDRTFGSSKPPPPCLRPSISIASGSNSSGKVSQQIAISSSSVHSLQAFPTDLTSRVAAPVQQGLPLPVSPTLCRSPASNQIAGGPETAGSMKNQMPLPPPISRYIKPTQHGISHSVPANFEPDTSTSNDVKAGLVQDNEINAEQSDATDLLPSSFHPQLASNPSHATLPPPPVTSQHPGLSSYPPVSHTPTSQSGIPSNPSQSTPKALSPAISPLPTTSISPPPTFSSLPASTSSHRSPVDLPTKILRTDAGLPPRPTTQPNDFLIEHSRRPILALKRMTPMPATKSVTPHTPNSNPLPSPRSELPSAAHQEPRGPNPKEMGVKRSASQEPDTTRPKKKFMKWKTREDVCSASLKSDCQDAAVRSIAFNSDGSHFAVCSNDRSIRIWNSRERKEVAKLQYSAGIISVAWMDDDAGVVALGEDGIISKWTRVGKSDWVWGKVLDAGRPENDAVESVCLAYMRDRIAVSFPRCGVKVWIWSKGTWQPQRSILRQNVSAIRFIADGQALLGGTKDGVLWYCNVPNGTLCAYAFLKNMITSIDVDDKERHALIVQAGGIARVVGINQDDGKGKIEKVFSCEELETQTGFGAVFVQRGQFVLFGCVDGCSLLWDRNKGEVIVALDHGEDELVQAVASFDRGFEGLILTGTQKGRLTWWGPHTG